MKTGGIGRVRAGEPDRLPGFGEISTSFVSGRFGARVGARARRQQRSSFFGFQPGAQGGELRVSFQRRFSLRPMKPAGAVGHPSERLARQLTTVENGRLWAGVGFLPGAEGRAPVRLPRRLFCNLLGKVQGFPGRCGAATARKARLWPLLTFRCAERGSTICAT